MAHAQSQTPAASDLTATQQPSRAQQLMGSTAPKLADLTDGVPKPMTTIHRPARLATWATSFCSGGPHHSGILGGFVRIGTS